MFFKRLSRSRSNSQSYVDTASPNEYHPPHDSKTNSQTYDHPDKLYSPVDAPLSRDGSDKLVQPALGSLDKEAMYARHSQPQEVNKYASPPQSAGLAAPGRGMSNGGGYGSEYGSRELSSAKAEQPPDILMQAFNMALKPHTDKVETLEAEIADLRAYIEQLEGQRGEVHAWIDKRGLRPDVPPSIAHTMDQSSHSTSPTHAASTLNAQLDRKITIVNFDLHRLQDDLNDSLPTPSFSACMLKFLPDITRLASLPSGPRYAFDLLLKLGGNLNSHGGLEAGDAEDIAERTSFYARLDDAMVEVVRGRFREEGDTWGVAREIKRIEKTGAYLRNWGVEPYFPQTLGVMREVGQAGGGGEYQ